MTKISGNIFHKGFVDSDRKHVLMITNHGIHQWNVIPGLPDTGGQNVFVNQFTRTLAKLGFKITIVNRGGYAHPVTGDFREGIRYKDEHRRIAYVQDSTRAFVRKEDMDDQLEELAEDLFRFIQTENQPIDFMVSHYWDAAKLGVLLNDKLPRQLKHIWVPHSTGALKKSNVKPERYKALRIDERIENERLIARRVDAIVDTSGALRQSLEEDYGVASKIFLPPCVMTDRFYPGAVDEDCEIWTFLSGLSGLSIPEIKRCSIITEISRTDTTKRKNILIEAFARVHRSHPDTFLIVAIDDNEKGLSTELRGMIDYYGLGNHVAAIGNEFDRMPNIYRVSNIYCSPSIMEGFGMSVQEAAASGVPVVGSALIPFVNEYLMGDEATPLKTAEGTVQSAQQGRGAIMVEPDNVDGFTAGIEALVADETLCQEMGRAAYDITIPYFTWDAMVRVFLAIIDMQVFSGDDPSNMGIAV